MGWGFWRSPNAPPHGPHGPRWRASVELALPRVADLETVPGRAGNRNQCSRRGPPRRLAALTFGKTAKGPRVGWILTIRRRALHAVSTLYMDFCGMDPAPMGAGRCSPNRFKSISKQLRSPTRLSTETHQTKRDINLASLALWAKTGGTSVIRSCQGSQGQPKLVYFQVCRGPGSPNLSINSPREFKRLAMFASSA